MTRTVCLIEGDGIGHEVIPAARRLLDATGLPLTFTHAQAGWDTFVAQGRALPESTLAAVRAADATLFGAVSSPLQPVEGYRSPIVAMRRDLGLYANLRPAISQPVAGSRANVDMLIVRENTEGLYAGRERREGDTAITERVITRQATERVVDLACRLALGRRQHLTVIHKANVLRATCGLFREVALEVVSRYAGLRCEEMLVDTAAMRLITDPERFDVLVAPNLFGDILSDEAAALVGGLGLAPSGNIGAATAIFEPVHGSAPDIAGQGIANPLAAILAAAMLLDYWGEAAWADKARAAVHDTLISAHLTPDLGGQATTDQVTDAVLERMRG